MSSSAVRRVQAALAKQPRLPLAQLPTPIHDAVRFRAALGGPARCPRILIKRDDLTALGLGGNKARKLEYLVADAQARGATTLVTTGAVQAQPGATTTSMAKRAAPPAHQQTGLPKIAASPGFVDKTTLLPKRGPQGAAIRSIAASEPNRQP